MRIDPVTLQILANYCAAAADSMGWTLMRTAHSTFVKETEDFSCQVLTPEGLTVARPRPSAPPGIPGSIMAASFRFSTIARAIFA